MFFNKKDNAVKAGKNTNPTTERTKKMMFKRKKTSEVISPKVDEKILMVKMNSNYQLYQAPQHEREEIKFNNAGFQINFSKDPATMSTKDLLEFQSAFFMIAHRSAAFYRMEAIWNDGTKVNEDEMVHLFKMDNDRFGLTWWKFYRGAGFPYNVGPYASWIRLDFAEDAVKSWSISLLKMPENNESRQKNYAGECIVHKKDNGYYAEFNLFSIWQRSNLSDRGYAVSDSVNRKKIQYHIDIVDNKFEFYWMMNGAKMEGMTTLWDLMNLDDPFDAYCAKSMYHCFMEWVSTIVSTESMMPITQYIPKYVFISPDDQFGSSTDLIDRVNYLMNFGYPNQVTKFEMDWIGREMSTKKILNRAYGNTHGVTKNFFGDINEIKDMDRLMFSIIMVLAFNKCNPTSFETLEYDVFWMEGLREYNKHLSLDLKIQTYIESVNRFIDIFGKRMDLMKTLIDRCYAAADMCELFDEFEDNEHRAAMVRAVAQQKMNYDEMREYFMSEKNKMTTAKVSIETSLKKMFDRFHEKKIDKNITVIVPQDNHDYITWGALQNNCIGSYSADANDPKMLIIGFRANNGKWIGHAKIDAFVSSGELHLQQLLGKSNSVLSTEERNIIVSFLEQNMVNCSSYTGMREIDLV